MVDVTLVMAVFNCSVLKVLRIEEKQFTEVCNLRIREMVNLSYSATDVAWSLLEGYLYFCIVVCFHQS